MRFDGSQRQRDAVGNLFMGQLIKECERQKLLSQGRQYGHGSVNGYAFLKLYERCVGRLGGFRFVIWGEWRERNVPAVAAQAVDGPVACGHAQPSDHGTATRIVIG
jgi:hypothetical protein